MGKRIAIVLALLLALPGCSACGGSSGAQEGIDAGATDDGGPGTDDTGSESGTGTDTGTDTESDDFTCLEPWVWYDLPPGEDCGPGCRQLSFYPEVWEREFDVWDGRLAFVEHKKVEGERIYQLRVVDYQSEKSMCLPDPVYGGLPIHEDHSFKSIAVFDDAVFFEGIVLVNKLILVRADLEQQEQAIFWLVDCPDAYDCAAPSYLDAHGDRLITTGGCTPQSTPNLCYFDPPWILPNWGLLLIWGNYGGYNSIWGDTLVFTYTKEGYDDIRGYDFAAEQLFWVTHDDGYQIYARVHESRVVYMELGDSHPAGDWHGAAVHMKDLETDEVTPIAGGEWIAAWPDIHGDIVVWLDWRDSSDPNDKNVSTGVEVWARNLATDVEAKVSDHPDRPKAIVRIWGDKVFVQMYKEMPTNEHGIFMLDLPEELL